MPPKESEKEIYFYTHGGDQLPERVVEIQDLTLDILAEMESMTQAIKTGMDGTLEFTVHMDEAQMRKLRKALIPKGMRNAEILKRDGYLSPENGEMT